MATSVLIPLSEYLKTTYRPDCDYVDGEVEERNLGETAHSLLQGIFFSLFQANRRAWGLLPLVEQRVQTGVTRFRIPDVCVMRPVDLTGPIVHKAPFLCVEILSSEDTLKRMQGRVRDYVAMGVGHIWIIDPLRRRAFYASNDGFEPAPESLVVPGTLIAVSLRDAFSELDDLLAGRL